MIRCGGDTDTTAAIVGAIIGTGVGRDGIPEDWVAGLWEWPRSVAWMERLAVATCHAIESGAPVRPPRVFPSVSLARNMVFLSVVGTHRPTIVPAVLTHFRNLNDARNSDAVFDSTSSFVPVTVT